MKEEIRNLKIFDLNDNENTPYHNLCEKTKEELKGKCSFQMLILNKKKF